jgi:hypothetical protein
MKMAIFTDGSLRVDDDSYAKSTCEYLSAKMLNSTMALCSTITVRRKADGTELQRLGTTYLLRKGPDGWRIRQLMVTDFDKLL